MNKSLYLDGDTSVTNLGCRRCNCYLVRSASRSLLVDCCMPLERSALHRGLKRRGVDRLDALILTHSHSDHAANAAYIQEQFACPVFVHKRGLEFLRRGRCRVSAGTTLVSSVISRLIRSGITRWEKFRPCPDAQPLENGTLASLGFQRLELLETPGHSDDSLSLLVNGEIALVGDALINNPRLGLFPIFAQDRSQVLASWEKLLTSGCGLFCPAHGKPVDRDLLQDVLIAAGVKRQPIRVKTTDL